MTDNKIHSLSFCLRHPPNHYCVADNAAAASAAQSDGMADCQAMQQHTQG